MQSKVLVRPGARGSRRYSAARPRRAKAPGAWWGRSGASGCSSKSSARAVGLAGPLPPADPGRTSAASREKALANTPSLARLSRRKGALASDSSPVADASRSAWGGSGRAPSRSENEGREKRAGTAAACPAAAAPPASSSWLSLSSRASSASSSADRPAGSRGGVCGLGRPTAADAPVVPRAASCCSIRATSASRAVWRVSPNPRMTSSARNGLRLNSSAP
mmetsp:Transcript_16286/g.61758  ORF Transcript_16286/g.61758 Transcript_16286/m.61758 type:complete len:221 (-) Transcript_16286:471-1133(-)